MSHDQEQIKRDIANREQVKRDIAQYLANGFNPRTDPRGPLLVSEIINDAYFQRPASGNEVAEAILEALSGIGLELIRPSLLPSPLRFPPEWKMPMPTLEETP